PQIAVTFAELLLYYSIWFLLLPLLIQYPKQYQVSKAMARTRSPPRSPEVDSTKSLSDLLPFNYTFNKRDQIFLGLCAALWLVFHVILTDLAATLQWWLLNSLLVYIAYQLAPFLYTSLHFIEKELVEPSGKAVLITGEF